MARPSTKKNPPKFKKDLKWPTLRATLKNKICLLDRGCEATYFTKETSSRTLPMTLGFYMIIMHTFKRTLSVISSVCMSKFTTVPLKPLSDQKCRRLCRFSRLKNVKFWKLLFFPAVDLRKSLYYKELAIEIISFQNFNHRKL